MSQQENEIIRVLDYTINELQKQQIRRYYHGDQRDIIISDQYSKSSVNQILKYQLKHVALNLKKPVKYKIQCETFFYYLNIIIVFVYYFFWHESLLIQEDFYNQFLQNINQDMIDDINITKGNCQTSFGKEYQPLFEYQWPGTLSACDCTKNLTPKQVNEMNSDLFFSNYFFIGRICKQLERENNCKSINELQPKVLSRLNDNLSSKPFILCAKRNFNISLKYNQSYCEIENRTVCGEGDKQFCLPPSVNCPISEIGFLKSKQEYLNFMNQSQKNRIIQINTELYFYYIKNSSELPISQVQLTETYQVCQLNSQQNTHLNRKNYYLMKVKKIPCNQTDSKFKIVYNISEEQLYLSNDLFYQERLLPYFQVSKKYNWTLQTKSYNHIKTECQISSSYQNILNRIIIKVYQKDSDYMEYIVYLNFLLLIIIFIDQYFEFQILLKHNIMKITKALSFLAIIIFDIVKFDNQSDLNYQLQDFKEFNNQNCSTNLTEPYILNLQDLPNSQNNQIVKLFYYLIKFILILIILYQFRPNQCRKDISKVHPQRLQ